MNRGHWQWQPSHSAVPNIRISTPTSRTNWAVERKVNTSSLVTISKSNHCRAIGLANSGSATHPGPGYSIAVHNRVFELVESKYSEELLGDLVWKLCETQRTSGLHQNERIVVDQPALKQALDGFRSSPGAFGRFMNEIQKQMATTKRNAPGPHRQDQPPPAAPPAAPPASPPTTPPKASRVNRIEVDLTSSTSKDEGSPKRRHRAAKTTKTLTISSDWSPTVIDALQKGDTKALKSALETAEQPAPKTLQEQLELAYPPTNKPYGPWAIPLPILVEPDIDLFLKDKRIVRRYLDGLILVYVRPTHSVRVSLSKNGKQKQKSPPMPKIPDILVARFARATTKIWKWAGAMTEARKVIPIDEWITSRLEAKGDKYKVAIYKYIDTLDVKTLNRCVRKKSIPAPVRKTRPSATANKDITSKKRKKGSFHGYSDNDDDKEPDLKPDPDSLMKAAKRQRKK
ncbi:hypothetical protein QBC37DRAFT_465314 [Rhypophila decipiens]|uniref:Uncharacterized protein n=1 Tax=Rhypophila decipiens TaxID=261697 RepID=A0AAN7BET6_9PEZI|nr:hypothetical protein QBC37DRAFT_465314 [Rhypophila decipiens]